MATVLALTMAMTVPAAGKVVRSDHRSGPKHIFYIMMENHGYSEIIGNKADAPYINKLVKHAGLATNYFGVTHPSLPNYLAAFSGSYQGIWDDCKAGADVFCAPEEFVPGSGDATAPPTGVSYLSTSQIASATATAHSFAGPNLVDQLETHGFTWKAYMQSMPGVGSQVEYSPVIGGVTVKLYAQKHNPFMYFSDINYAGSPRLNNIVPFEGNFASDLATGNVPNFVWISPDQCHDMHGMSPSGAALIGMPTCGYPASGLDHGAIQLGDQFLKDTVSQITHSRTWHTSDSSIVIVWDEDDYAAITGCCNSPTGVNGVTLGGAQVPAIVLNSRGSDDATRANGAANHYTLLAAIERLWNLGCINESCSVNGRRLARLFH
jgi:hypothetical protein